MTTALHSHFWLGGSPCSGKSTAAEPLSRRHGLVHHRCDDHFDAHRAPLPHLASFLFVIIASICSLSAAPAEPIPHQRSAEELSPLWGGKLTLRWPAEWQPVRVESQQPGELIWEDAIKTWTLRLSQLAPPQAGFTLATVSASTMALLEKGGGSVVSRMETIEGSDFFVIELPPKKPHGFRELWMRETADGVVGIWFFSTLEDFDSARLAARSAMQSFQWPADQAPLTEAQMREDLRQLVRVADSAWAWKDMRREKSGVNLEEIEQRLASRIQALTTPEEFGRLLKEFAAALKDGHASVGTSLVADPVHRLPFECRETDEGIIVSNAGEGSSGMTAGDKLLSIDSVAVEDIIDDRLARTPASTEQARRYHVVRGLPLVSAANPVVIELEKLDGTKASVTLSPVSGIDSIAEEISHRRLADDLGYMRLPSFAQDTAIWEKGGRNVESLRAALESKFQQIRAAFADLQDCSALILDLRDNGGGSDLLGQFVARALAPDAKVYYHLGIHISPELLALPEFAPLKVYEGSEPPRSPVAFQDIPNPPPPFGGKLYILMNEGCFSATDCFLHFIAHTRPDAVLVGMPNGAGAGAPRQIVKLTHSGARLTLCVMRVWNLRGEFIDGNPLTPTLRVRPTRSDLAAGRDAELTAALNAIAAGKP